MALPPMFSSQTDRPRLGQGLDTSPSLIPSRRALRCSASVTGHSWAAPPHTSYGVTPGFWPGTALGAAVSFPWLFLSPGGLSFSAAPASFLSFGCSTTEITDSTWPPPVCLFSRQSYVLFNVNPFSLQLPPTSFIFSGGCSW